MIKVNVLSEENSWSKKIKKKELFFNKICNKFPKKYRFINKKIYLTLLLSNNKEIKILNKKFRNSAFSFGLFNEDEIGYENNLPGIISKT